MDAPDKLSIDDLKAKVTRRLSNVPELPGRTEARDDYIGADTSTILDDDQLSKKDKQDRVRGTLSREGEPYDPLLHSWPPSQTKAGNWKKRRASKGGASAEPDSNAQYRAAAGERAHLFANLLHVALGEGAEADYEKLNMLTDGLEAKYRRDGIPEGNPWLNIFLGGASYTWEVANRPQPKKKLAPLWNWTKSKARGFWNWLGFGERDESLLEEVGEVMKGDHARSDSRE